MAGIRIEPIDLSQPLPDPFPQESYTPLDSATLVADYQKAFQDPEWYEANKDNFCQSLLEKFRNEDWAGPFLEMYEQSGRNSNFLDFGPNEWIRFGILHRISRGNDIIYIVEIPAGFRAYHSSRSLSLSHDDFPMRGYSRDADRDINRYNVTQACPDNQMLGHSVDDVMRGLCTRISYYTDPLQGQEYRTPEKLSKFGAKQVFFAYGIPYHTDKPELHSLYQNKNFNDRTSVIPDHTGSGVMAYVTDRPMLMYILALDTFLVRRPTFAFHNSQTIYNAILQKQKDIRKIFGLSQSYFKWFLKAFRAISGISVIDLAKLLRDTYAPGISNQQVYGNLHEFLRSARNRVNMMQVSPLVQGSVSTAADMVPRDVYGFRFSTFELDRPVLNFIMWYLQESPWTMPDGSAVVIDGFVSSNMFNSVANPGSTTGIMSKQIGQLIYPMYNPSFHSEMGLFYAPDVLRVDTTNKYSLNYDINHLGIIQELRKYKTSNIMYITEYGQLVNFHQGHLYEHSSWVSISAQRLFDLYFGGVGLDRNTIIITALLHDIGKAGECGSLNYSYQMYSLARPKTSRCTAVTLDSNGRRVDQDDEVKRTVVGMSYYDIPEHPERGYRYLRGYQVFKNYTLGKTDLQETEYADEFFAVYEKIPFTMWEEYLRSKIPEEQVDFVPVAVATHWNFGDMIMRNISDPSFQADPRPFYDAYLRYIELYYNDVKYVFDKGQFALCVMLVLVISIADILGSEYTSFNKSGDPRTWLSPAAEASLSEAERVEIYNEFPNYSSSNPVDTARQIKNYDSWKKRIIQNIRYNAMQQSMNILQYVYSNFEPNGKNSYATLYNFTELYYRSYDLLLAYTPFFPRVIAFDLDQTLFAADFSAKHYYIYRDVHAILEECQRLRYYGVKICIASRHWAPVMLYKYLRDNSSPMRDINFDMVVSRYTGPGLAKELEGYNINSTKFFDQFGAPDQGFVLINPGKDDEQFREISDDEAGNVESKVLHMDLIISQFGVSPDDVLLFDDDRKYFVEGAITPGVHVAGVPVHSAEVKRYEAGLSYPIFRQALGIYTFNRYTPN